MIDYAYRIHFGPSDEIQQFIPENYKNRDTIYTSFFATLNALAKASPVVTDYSAFYLLVALQGLNPSQFNIDFHRSALLMHGEKLEKSVLNYWSSVSVALRLFSQWQEKVPDLGKNLFYLRDFARKNISSITDLGTKVSLEQEIYAHAKVSEAERLIYLRDNVKIYRKEKETYYLKETYDQLLQMGTRADIAFLESAMQPNWSQDKTNLWKGLLLELKNK